jgi:TonB family protein
MKKIFNTTILIFVSFLIFGQNSKVVVNGMIKRPPASVEKNYKKGTRAIKSNNYKEGISYLTLSIDEFPTADAYFDRAAAYYNLGDTCSFCNDLAKASKLNDFDALNLFNEKCLYTITGMIVPDSIQLRYPDVKSIEIVHTKCSSDSLIKYIHEYNGEPSISQVITETDYSPVFTIVEEMPAFIGGEKARNRFLAENIRYPKEAINLRIQGTVYVSFIINSDGTVTDVRILRGIGGGCDEEAERVVKMMPNWIPGRQNGKPVRVLFNMPLQYTLVK